MNGRLFAADIDSADVLPEREAEIEASADADEAETTAETDVDVEAEAEWMSEINEAAEVEDIWTDDAVDAVSRATYKKKWFHGHYIVGKLISSNGRTYAQTTGGGGDVSVFTQIEGCGYYYSSGGWYASSPVSTNSVPCTSGITGGHGAQTLNDSIWLQTSK